MKRTERDPAHVVSDALHQLGRLGVLENPEGLRDGALAALQQLARQRDNPQGEAQHWLDMYTARLTAEHTRVSDRPEGHGTHPAAPTDE